MMYQVKIKNLKTNETRTIDVDGDFDGAAEFLWTDGQNGCDCNLHYYFTDWNGTDCPCGDTEYEVLGFETTKGEE